MNVLKPSTCILSPPPIEVRGLEDLCTGGAIISCSLILLRREQEQRGLMPRRGLDEYIRAPFLKMSSMEPLHQDHIRSVQEVLKPSPLISHFKETVDSIVQKREIDH